MLIVKNLSKNFGQHKAVENLHLEVREGEKLILLGSSGSGKSTCLKMINRLIEPTEGEIWLNGENILAQKPEVMRRRIGYIIQNIGLFPHYTVAQNIALVPNLLKWPQARIKARTEELLSMLRLEPENYLKRYPHELSGGQQQRIGIARALAADPPLLLMDEPFGALDPITRAQIQQDFKKIEKIAQKTLLLVTHDVAEAVLLGTRICLLDQGKVQQIGTPKELIFSPKNQFVVDFFQSARFQLELQVIKLKDIERLLNWNDLPATQPDPLATCQAEDSLLEILEKQSNSTHKQGIVYYQEENQRYVSTTRDDLLKALDTWKKDQYIHP